jgi:hypothetical protein
MLLPRGGGLPRPLRGHHRPVVLPRGEKGLTALGRPSAPLTFNLVVVVGLLAFWSSSGAEAVTYGPFNTTGFKFATGIATAPEGGSISFDTPLIEALRPDGNGIQTVQTMEPPRASYAVKLTGYDFSSIPDAASISGFGFRAKACQNGQTVVSLWRLGWSLGGFTPFEWAVQDHPLPTTFCDEFELGAGSMNNLLGMNSGMLGLALKNSHFGLQLRGVSGTVSPGNAFIFHTSLAAYWTWDTTITSTTPTFVTAATGGAITVYGATFGNLPGGNIRCRYDGQHEVGGGLQSALAVLCGSYAMPMACTRDVMLEVSLDGSKWTNGIMVEYQGTTANPCPTTTGDPTTADPTTNANPITTGAASTAPSPSTTGVPTTTGIPTTTGVATTTGTLVSTGARTTAVTSGRISGGDVRASSDAAASSGSSWVITLIIIIIIVAVLLCCGVAAVVVWKRRGRSESETGDSVVGQDPVVLTDVGTTIGEDFGSSEEDDVVYADVKAVVASPDTPVVYADMKEVIGSPDEGFDMYA